MLIKMTEKYDYRIIEKKWREFWLSEKTFKTVGLGEEGFDAVKPKCYVLDMFPYPSGAGLCYRPSQRVYSQRYLYLFKKMQGYNVHPMGFDSFGLPAEQL